MMKINQKDYRLQKLKTILQKLPNYFQVVKEEFVGKMLIINQKPLLKQKMGELCKLNPDLEVCNTFLFSKFRYVSIY